MKQLPIFERVAGGGATLPEGYTPIGEFGLIGAIIDGHDQKLIVKVKAKAGEDGMAETIPFLYKKLGDKDFTQADADGVELAPDFGAVLGVISTDTLAHGGFDRLCLSLESDGGTLGTTYIFYAEPRYSDVLVLGE